MTLTICTKFNITAETFEKMYEVFTAENGNELFHTLTATEKELYWNMYEAMDQYSDLLNPRPVVAQPKRKARKAA